MYILGILKGLKLYLTLLEVPIQVDVIPDFDVYILSLVALLAVGLPFGNPWLFLWYVRSSLTGWESTPLEWDLQLNFVLPQACSVILRILLNLSERQFLHLPLSNAQQQYLLQKIVNKLK